jgi:hypothetical protein
MMLIVKIIKINRYYPTHQKYMLVNNVIDKYNHVCFFLPWEIISLLDIPSCQFKQTNLAIKFRETREFGLSEAESFIS